VRGWGGLVLGQETPARTKGFARQWSAARVVHCLARDAQMRDGRQCSVIESWSMVGGRWSMVDDP
jgi:hypothetical protein